MSKSYTLTFLAVGILLCGAALALVGFEAFRIGVMSPLEYLLRAGGPLVSGILILIMARRAKASEVQE